MIYHETTFVRGESHSWYLYARYYIPRCFLSLTIRICKLLGDIPKRHENLRRETPLTYRYYVRQPLCLSRVSSVLHALRTHVISIRSQGRNHPFIFYVPRIPSILRKWKKNRYWRRRREDFSKVEINSYKRFPSYLSK